MNKQLNYKYVISITVLSILYIACFPVNPLVLTRIIKVESYFSLLIIGWIVWVFGMVLVMAPIVIFPRRGGVPKGKSFVHTTQLVDTGIYAVVRHPQYLGIILATFGLPFLRSQVMLMTIVSWIILVCAYIWLARREEANLQEEYGEEFSAYKKRVPFIFPFRTRRVKQGE